MTGKDIIKITLNLMVIYIVGGFLLAWVYATTSPIVYKKTQEEKQAALKEMMPGVQKIDKEGDWQTPEGHHSEYYAGRNGAESQGYVVETFGKGYSSFIDIMASVGQDMKIRKIKILHHGETPGLGDEVEAPWFTKQFEGKGLDQMKVIKGETTENIQAISGATISSRAATRGVQYALELLKQKYGANGGAMDNAPAGMNSCMKNCPDHKMMPGMMNCPKGHDCDNCPKGGMMNCPEHGKGMKECPKGGMMNCPEHEKHHHDMPGHDMSGMHHDMPGMKEGN